MRRMTHAGATGRQAAPATALQALAHPPSIPDFRLPLRTINRRASFQCLNARPHQNRHFTIPVMLASLFLLPCPIPIMASDTSAPPVGLLPHMQ
jgi:hypothetical protein